MNNEYLQKDRYLINSKKNNGIITWLQKSLTRIVLYIYFMSFVKKYLSLKTIFVKEMVESLRITGLNMQNHKNDNLESTKLSNKMKISCQ